MSEPETTPEELSTATASTIKAVFKRLRSDGRSPRKSNASPLRSVQKTVWLGVLCAIPFVALGLIRTVSPRTANRAELGRIADTFEAQTNRHRLTYQLTDGEPRLLEELWVKGKKFRDVNNSSRVSGMTAGYDGKRSYWYSDLKTGYLASQSAPIPEDDLDVRMKSQKGTWMKSGVAKTQDGMLTDLYVREGHKYRVECYVDSRTSLPMQWDVQTADGETIERRTYEYPAKIDDSVFSPPTLVTAKLPLPNPTKILTPLGVKSVHTLSQGVATEARPILQIAPCPTPR